jgi:peptidoglycan/xylan/chitin deacetylase (PgdA/CDA1 family)
MDYRRPLRWFRAQTLDSLGFHRRAHQRLDGSRAAVLMYHRVLPRVEVLRGAVEPGMYVTPETFAQHLDWLEADFRVLPLHEIASNLAKGRPLPRGAVAITFDDGWRDNHEHALPALAARGLPATVFVVTDRVGTEGAFWPDEVCSRMTPLSGEKQRELASALGVTVAGDAVQAVIAQMKNLPEAQRQSVFEQLQERTVAPAAGTRELLNWPEIDRLADAGVDVESHGASHAILTRVSKEAAEHELRSARQMLLDRGHGRHALFAYPSGAHDTVVRGLAAGAGYTAAVATTPGLAGSDSDPMALPRFGLHDDVSRTRVEFLHRLVVAA